jgi:hypothetical protein
VSLKRDYYAIEYMEKSINGELPQGNPIWHFLNKKAADAVRAAEKMFDPDLLVYESVFGVAAMGTYNKHAPVAAP